MKLEGRNQLQQLCIVCPKVRFDLLDLQHYEELSIVLGVNPEKHSTVGSRGKVIRTKVGRCLTQMGKVKKTYEWTSRFGLWSATSTSPHSFIFALPFQKLTLWWCDYLNVAGKCVHYIMVKLAVSGTRTEGRVDGECSELAQSPSWSPKTRFWPQKHSPDRSLVV